MAGHDLLTAKYLKPDDKAPSMGVATATEASPPPATRVTGLASASRWISLVVIVAFIACGVGLAVPYVKAVSAGKAMSPIAWLNHLRAQPGQAFEKMIRDRGEAVQREWADKNRQSPGFQIDPSKPMEWNFEPAANFK
jgi:hypothetical protein